MPWLEGQIGIIWGIWREIKDAILANPTLSIPSDTFYFKNKQKKDIEHLNTSLELYGEKDCSCPD